MQLVQSKKYNKELTQQFNEYFGITDPGLYLLEITASAKSWWQNTKTGRSFLKKDSLTLLLDEKPLIKFENKKLYSTDLWNGNLLKGHDQTAYVIVAFDAGNHSFIYNIHGKPLLDTVTLYRIENQKVELKKLKPKTRDRIPWLVVIFTEPVALLSLTINAIAKKHDGDDDDLRISFNGDGIQNENIKAHHDWYWCGKILKGALKTFQKDFDENYSPTRINLDADGTPEIETLEITISLKENEKFKHVFTMKDVKQYTFKGAHGHENYNRFDNEILEAVNHWNQEFNDEYPPDEPLHPNLVKALVYIESRMGYFETNGYPSYPDIMQVANPDNPAIHTLNKSKDAKGHLKKESEWKDDKIIELNYRGKANGNSPSESITWGVRWLYHKAQGITYEKKRYWRSWKQAVQLYNGGGNSNYANEVYDVYTHGIDQRNKKNPLRIFLLSFLFMALLSFSSFGVHALLKHTNSEQISDKSSSMSDQADILDGDIPQKVKKIMDEKIKIYERQDTYYYGDLFEDPTQLCRQHDDECFSELIFTSYVNELILKSRSMNAFRQVVQPFGLIDANNSFYDDLDNDGEAELVFVLPDFLNREYLEISIIDQQKDAIHVIRKKINRPYSGGPLRIVDVTGDTIPEIIVFASGGRQDIQAYIFQYINNSLYLILELERGYLRADIIITNQNYNHIPELVVRGEQYGDECMACDHKKIEEVFEYNPMSKKFDLLSNTALH